MRSFNGFPCRNCADEELAKRGVDPAHPTRALSGSEVYISPAEAARNRGTPGAELGVNRPESSGAQGRKVNLYA